MILTMMVPMIGFGMDRMAALSMIESGNNDRVVGRAGEISRYQILKAEWRSVTNSTRYTDPETARTVTLRLLDRRVMAFRETYHRNPTHFEFYGLWNAPGQIMERRVSRTVAERCRRFANLCEHKERPTLTAGVQLASVSF